MSSLKLIHSEVVGLRGDISDLRERMASIESIKDDVESHAYTLHGNGDPGLKSIALNNVESINKAVNEIKDVDEKIEAVGKDVTRVKFGLLGISILMANEIPKTWAMLRNFVGIWI